MPAGLLGIFLVGLTVLMAHGGLIVVRRRVAPAALREHHDVAGFIIALGLFLISALNYAFSGDLRVRSDAFQNVLEGMDRIEGGATGKIAATTFKR